MALGLVCLSICQVHLSVKPFRAGQNVCTLSSPPTEKGLSHKRSREKVPEKGLKNLEHYHTKGTFDPVLRTHIVISTSLFKTD